MYVNVLTQIFKDAISAFIYKSCIFGAWVNIQA